ncbi:MAG: O-antigen ligase family protein [Candidatus Gracilibacteria bacterium]|nr:O-antigen ligase family protein [Candidatus Gracilibacteria bacterium]
MFDRIFRIFLILLPWSVLASVFLGSKLAIPGVNFFKEIFLGTLIIVLVLDFWKRKIFPKLDILDYLIGSYIGYLVIVTLVNGLGLASLVYGGRYDFEFLIAFLVAKHGSGLLVGSVSQYVKIFLISASSALAIGILVRFVFHETILLHFGFSPNLSNWSFGGTPPIYHGIDGARVRRFQGIFDGPNPAAYFIIVYLGLLAHYFRTKKAYHFLVGIWSIILLGLVFLTYSRSALIGIVLGCVTLVIFSLGTIWRKYKKESIYIVLLLAVLLGLFYLRYEGTIDRIILRSGSSQGHFDRAMTGIERFQEHPMGQGLGTAGPAYRYVVKLADDPIYGGDIKASEDYYIPESWYIQQLVEGGVVAFVLFCAIIGTIAWLIFPLSPALFASFIAVLTMNLFLHSFESVYISLILFLILGVFVGKRKGK